MANRPARCTRADLRHALEAPAQLGIPVRGYEIAPDGTVRVLFGSEVIEPLNTLEQRAEAYAQARRMARGRD